ncbi:hypothetical protein [Micromonospora kangleipakensis]|uniref:hypothetical protein n=1 Tax=Micromonospora kangleipakensis TaxID=1077942 RepID=UPI001028FC7C|nr:hypothetical protein [Micromonospora kangleipakensis]
MRGDTVAATDGTASGWRTRWARRENERRRTAYEAAVAAWRRRQDELRQCCDQAEEAEEPAEPPVGLPVPLAQDEVVAAVQPAAELIEVTARHTTGLPAPELTVVPVEETARKPRLPKGVAVVDAGMAVVTNRRLILVGRGGTREWAYPEVARVAHDPREPFTLLHPHDAGGIGGVRVPRAAASGFRLRLTLAYAEATGARDALLDRLDEAVVAHWRSRPAEPAAATPAEAPVVARLARPALVAAVAVLVAVAAVSGVVRRSTADRPVVGMQVDGGTGPAVADPSAPSTSASIGAPITSTGPTTGPLPTGTGAPGSPAPGTAPAAPGSGPATSGAPGPTSGGSRVTPSNRPTPGGTGPSTGSPSPTAVDFCGAPENPYGYNYCGGSYIDDPAPDVCDWFDCVDTLWDGKGYLVLCEDGLISMTGVQRGPCADHGGTRHPVYV